MPRCNFRRRGSFASNASRSLAFRFVAVSISLYIGRNGATFNADGGNRVMLVKLRSSEDKDGKNVRKVSREDSLIALRRSFKVFRAGKRGSAPTEV